MTLPQNIRTGVFIDGDNFDFATRDYLPRDYRMLREALIAHFDKPIIHYYYSTPTEDKNALPFFERLTDLGVITKSVPLFKGNGPARTNIDVVIAADIIENIQDYDRIVLVSGDNDFVPVLHALNARGKYTIVVADPIASGRFLRKAATEFVSLHELLTGVLKGVSPSPADERGAVMEEIYFEKGYRFEAYYEVRKRIVTARGMVRLVDRYVTIDVLHLLNVSPPNVIVRVWMDKPREHDFEHALRVLRQDGRDIEVYYTGRRFHGRFLIIDDQYWHLGHSIKDLGSSDAIIQKMNDKVAIQTLEGRLAGPT